MPEPLITVAIATRNDYRGLWFTVHSALSNVVNTELDGLIGITVVNNSDNPIEHGNIKSFCSRIGSSLKYKETETYSNHFCRNEAVRMSDSEYTVLCDSHVVFGRDFFKECMKILVNNQNMGMVHTPFCYNGVSSAIRRMCFYNLSKFSINLHGTFSRYGALFNRPYPIAIAPHAAVMFRTKQWLDYGGYMDECIGHGGGEPYVTYKYWMFGSQVCVTPHSIYSHWRHASYKKSRGDWRRNMTMTAFALGGEEAGREYAIKLKCGPIADQLWEESKKYNEFVRSKQIIEFKDLPNRMHACKARPLSKEMPEAI